MIALAVTIWAYFWGVVILASPVILLGLAALATRD